MNDGLFLTFLASAMAASTAARSWSPNMAATDANEQVVLWLWLLSAVKGAAIRRAFSRLRTIGNILGVETVRLHALQDVLGKRQVSRA